MVLVLVLVLGSPDGFEHGFEQEYHFIEYDYEYEYDNAVVPYFVQHLVVVISEKCFYDFLFVIGSLA
jgi:hypothetical protein